MASDAMNPNDEALPVQSGRDVRIDGAHPMRTPALGDARSRTVVAAASGAAQHADSAHDDVSLLDGALDELTPLASSPLMLAQHAANLADRLQERLGEVDRRESRLNSQEAEFDSRVRNARLWIDGRDAEITETQQRLETWEKQLAARQESAAAQLDEADELTQRLQELAVREKAAATLQIELELGRTEQQTKIDSLEFEAAACRTKQLELDQAKQRVEQRQRDLDQREASLYVDQERVSRERIVLDGRETQLASRETALTACEAASQECERRLSEEAGAIEFERAELQQSCSDHAERVEQLAADGHRLEFRQREIETALKRFERLGIIEQKMVEVQQQADEFAMRSAYLDNAEAMLAERQMQLADQQRELEREQLAFENQVTRERRTLVADGEQAKALVERRQRELEQREAALDQRQQALEELADQLRSTQRESLEMRLATEETWLQLQGALAPAALSRSIAQVRGRLADHFHLAADEVRVRRQELELVRAELSEQLEGLQLQREELQRWSELREQDVETRAAHLVAREGELDGQQRYFETQQRQWDAERTAYQQEIQRLLAELRGAFRAAA